MFLRGAGTVTSDNCPEQCDLRHRPSKMGGESALVHFRRSATPGTVSECSTIYSEKKLASSLGVTRAELFQTLDAAEDYYKLLCLYDPAKPDKLRDIVSVTGSLRRLQSVFYRHVLLRRLKVSPYSHGGIRSRSTKTNASVHLNSSFIFKADISNFYPSISQSRVFRLFRDRFCCSPPVAALCTRLCTFEHYLALGLITSPMLADQIVQPIDYRIGAVCASADSNFTRFVDDITISADYDLSKSGLPKLILRILAEHGLHANFKKNVFGRFEEGMSITGIRRNRRGNMDVAVEYAEELAKTLHDAKRLSAGVEYDLGRPYYTPTMIYGRIQFVASVNRRRGLEFLKQYRRIDWKKVELAAHEQRLIISKKQIVTRDEKPAPILA